jgi:hypothetical protein
MRKDTETAMVEFHVEAKALMSKHTKKSDEMSLFQIFH